MAALCITQTTGYGVLYYAFSVFIRPMEAELGWNRAQLTGAFSLAALVAAFAAVPIGRFLDRHGSRAVMTLGSLLGAGVMCAWSGVQTLPMYVGIMLLLSLAGGASLYETAFPTIAKWFAHRRRQAIITLTLAAGFASAIFLPLTQWLIDLQGWRAALVSLGVIQLVFTVPLHWFILRKAPTPLEEPPPVARPKATPAGDSAKPTAAPKPFVQITPDEAIRRGQFRWLLVARALFAFVGASITIHMVAYLNEAGFSPAVAVGAGSLAGLMSFPTRIAYSLIGERLPRRTTLNGVWGVQLVAAVLLASATTEGSVALFAVSMGISRSILSPVVAVLLADLYGTAHYGAINGMVAMAGAVAGSLGPVIVAAVRDATGDYTLVLAGLVGVAALGLASINLAVRSQSSRASADGAG